MMGDRDNLNLYLVRECLMEIHCADAPPDSVRLDNYAIRPEVVIANLRPR